MSWLKGYIPPRLIAWRPGQWARWRFYVAEWCVILFLAYLYSGQYLLDFDAQQLQQTGEHNESATLPLLAEISLKRYGEIPLWNPYMLTGFPHAGDFINHFWNPVATLPVLVWGGINGMKVSVFLSLALAGLGQWLLAHVFGVRGMARLWAGLLFMVSGGLALLWRLGWYELLLGAVWFPWCFAVLWWALRRHDRASLALTAICIALVITTGGGYYPFYLFICLSVLVGMALLWVRPAERWGKLRRAMMIALLSAGLLAVVLLPLIDGYRFTRRDALPDLEQRLSQPITYALINYVVSAPEWFRADILAKGSGWSWFYIGYLPLLALTLIPWAYSRARWRRPAISVLAVLTLVLLALQASRYLPFSAVYRWIPFLYTFRFPNRLLVIAASPLIVLAALGLQQALFAARRGSRGWGLAVVSKKGGGGGNGISARWVVSFALFLLLAWSVRDVFKVNKSFGFALQQRNDKPFTALSWLKNHDSGLYYTNLGGGVMYWDWAPAGYELEMPMINFRYNRRLLSLDAQTQPESPFQATAQYMFALPDQPKPDNAQLLTEFDDVGLWYLPDALPFAFTVSPARLQSASKLARTDVAPLAARLAGVNQVVVRGAPQQAGDQLVVLVSDYPGWRLYVDGQPAALKPVNGYLGAAMPAGDHTYTFIFRPTPYYAGLAISLLTLVIMGGILLLDLRRKGQPPGRQLPLSALNESEPVSAGQPS